MPNPRQLSRELRLGESRDLKRRRWIVGLSLFGATMGQIVSLYQMGILRRLPDPPSDLFDATRVDASDYAYKRYQTPDGLMMIGTYAVTAILAGAGGERRNEEHPILPLLLFGKTVYDAALCVKLAREEWDENGAFCEYCQAASLASVASVGLALPGALKAASHLLASRR